MVFFKFNLMVSQSDSPLDFLRCSMTVPPADCMSAISGSSWVNQGQPPESTQPADSHPGPTRRDQGDGFGQLLGFCNKAAGETTPPVQALLGHEREDLSKSLPGDRKSHKALLYLHPSFPFYSQLLSPGSGPLTDTHSQTQACTPQSNNYP